MIDRYRDGVTIADTLHELGADAGFGQLATQGAIEGAVLDLLRDPKAPKRRRAARRMREGARAANAPGSLAAAG